MKADKKFLRVMNICTLAKGYMILSVFLLIISGCGREKQCDIEIRSSVPALDSAFNWAKVKARSYVMTGKSGRVNVSERSAGGDSVAFIPSYWAGYPHRSAFYSRDYCHQMSGAHLLGLNEENLAMQKAFAASANVSRKWYPLWAINFDGSSYDLDYVSDTLFVREVPAVFELVEKGYKQYLWTANEELIRDSVLWNYYTRAVDDFVRFHDNLRPNGVAEGDGSGNIFRGTATYNEGRGLPYIEAGDGIACQYQAFLAYAGMLEKRGETEKAKEWANKAEQFRGLFNTVWGISGEPDQYIRGYDVKGTACTGFGKETSWFIPMKLITTDVVRVNAFLDFMTKHLLDSRYYPDNIEAVTYLPDTYFAYNRTEEGWYWIKHIISEINRPHLVKRGGTNGDYPEISYTLISSVVENLLGVEPDAPGHQVAVISRLPEDIQFLEVKNIPLGEHLIDVEHTGLSATRLRHVQGTQPLKCVVRFYGRHSVIKVNNKEAFSAHNVLNGSVTTEICVFVEPGEEILVEI